MSKEFKRPKLHDHDSSEHQPPVKRPSQAISEKPPTNDEDLEEPKKKISFGLPKAKGLLSTNPRSNLKTSSIKIKLNSAQKSISESVKFKPKLSSTALAFSSNDDDEEEEMPPEAKMRMKNIGRETPTSSGPNSFGKSRIGFCDSKKMYERKLRDMPKDDFDD